MDPFIHGVCVCRYSISKRKSRESLIIIIRSQLLLYRFSRRTLSRRWPLQCFIPRENNSQQRKRLEKKRQYKSLLLPFVAEVILLNYSIINKIRNSCFFCFFLSRRLQPGENESKRKKPRCMTENKCLSLSISLSISPLWTNCFV